MSRWVAKSSWMLVALLAFACADEQDPSFHIQFGDDRTQAGPAEPETPPAEQPPAEGRHVEHPVDAPRSTPGALDLVQPDDGMQLDAADPVDIEGRVNRAPYARVTGPSEAEAGVAVTLDASTSSDPDGQVLSFVWTQTAGPAVELRTDGATAHFVVPPEHTDLTFRVVVSDGELDAPAATSLHVRNSPPEAVASGPNEPVAGTSMVHLDASLSSDRNDDRLTYRWVQMDGPAVNLDDAESETPSFAAPRERSTLRWRVDVSDGRTDASAAVVVTVANNAPAAVARAETEVESGTVVDLDGTDSYDNDWDALRFRWSQIDGIRATLSNPTAPRPHITVPAGPTELVYELVVNDGYVDSAPTIVRLSVDNALPLADAGADVDSAGGAQVVLDGTASEDPEGAQLTYAWRQLDGDAVELADATSATPSFVAPARATLVFELVVRDGRVDSEPDQVVVNVDNARPIADAGEGQTAWDGAVIVLDGSGSSDADGDEIAFAWRQVEGTPVVVTGADRVRPWFTAPAGRDRLVFELVVSDALSDSEAQRVQVLTNNTAPIADAGRDQQVAGGTVVSLDGSASRDTDRDALRYEWVQEWGEPVQLAGLGGPGPVFTAPHGSSTLVFALVVDDGLATSEAARVRVHVDNAPPVANAGPNQEAEFGDEVVLDGSGSEDPDGDALYYHWSQLAGPLVEIEGPDTASPRFTAPDEAGRLVFRLVVDDGLTESAPVNMTVNIREAADPG